MWINFSADDIVKVFRKHIYHPKLQLILPCGGHGLREFPLTQGGRKTFSFTHVLRYLLGVVA